MFVRKRIKRWALPATVFFTGAGVLVVEIIATRILAPYFGNTIFTISSVLSVVLAALSIGYYVGGKFADRQPTWETFYGIVSAGGIGVFVLYWLQLLILPALGDSLPLTFGPLVASVLLFFVPSFILGMLSPFAIKLQQMTCKHQGIGSISGEMFFYSTLGSIFGSLFAGYVLIPYVGTRIALLGVALFLIALGIVPLLVLGADKRFIRKISLLVLLGVLASLFVAPAQHAVYSHDGVYEKIAIVDGDYHGQPTRFLFQDRSASGAMYIQSGDLVYDYAKYYAAHELFVPEVKRALVIGGGAYSIPKALIADLPHVTVDVVEIEPKLYELSQQYFNVPTDNPRLNNHTDDGRRFLRTTNEQYDFIFGDAYHSLYSVPTHLTTKEFFQTVYAKLANEGVFMMNIIGSLDRQPPSVILSEIRTLQEVFPRVYAFATDSPDTDAVQNIILVAHKSNRQVLPTQEFVNGHPQEIMKNLPAKQVNLAAIDWNAYPVLTDDYSPIDSWTAQLLRRHGL